MSGGVPAFSGGARVLRGLALGAVVLTLSLAGHAAVGGGSLPDGQTLVVLLTLTTLLSTAVADRRRSLGWLIAVMAALQVLLHAVTTTVTAHPGHADSLIPSPSMLLGHAIATLLAAVALTRADDLWARWRRFLNDLAREFSLPPLPVPLSGVALAPRPPVVVERYAAQPVLRRGPPVAPAR